MLLSSSWILFRYTLFSSIQSLSRVRLFATPWITAHQASLSNFQINNTVLLTVVTMLYITSPEFFITGSLYVFGQLHPFPLLLMRDSESESESPSVHFSSVAQSCPTLCDQWIAARQASLSITNSRSLLNSCPSSRWYHPAISSSVVPFSSCPQTLPSESFPMSQLFAWGGQRIGVSALAWVLPMNTQDWSPLGWTGWISLQSKGLSRVFSNTTVQKHQFLSTQSSSQSNSHIHTWPQEKL